MAKLISNQGKTGSGAYGWAKVDNGRLIEVGVELIREGGVVWTPNNKANYKTAKAAALSLAEDWPNLYKRIQKAAFKENFPSPTKAARVILNRDIDRLFKEVVNEQSALDKKKTKLARMRKQLETL